MNNVLALVLNGKTKNMIIFYEVIIKYNKYFFCHERKPFEILTSCSLLILILISQPSYAYQVNGTAGTSDSIAIGGAAGTCESSTDALSPSSIAIGCNATVSGGGGGVALGNGASVQKTNGVAIGTNATAVKEGSIAIGTGSVAGDALNNFDFQVAIGNNAHATAQNSLAIGDQSLASGVQSTAVGSGSIANAAQASAFGRLSSAGNNGTAVGMNAKATSTRSTALGQGATATATDGTAIGQGASVTANSSVALGRGSVASRTSSVSIGDVGSERQLVNLAAGEISVTSTDGINGSQLFNTNTFITNTLGGGATTTADGTMLPPSYTLYNASNGTTTTTDNIGTAFDHFNSQGLKYFHVNSTGVDAQANGVDSIAIGSAALAQNDNSIALGANSITAATVATASSLLNGTTYSFAGNAPVGTLSVGSVGAERTLTNMAAGRLSGTSTDAVNGSQLFATNQALNSLDNSMGGLDDRAIKYDLNADTSVNYGQATLAGNGGTKLSNVAAGDLSTTSTDAVNGSQLNATNNQVATNTNDITTLGTTVATQGDNITQIYGTGTKYFHANSTGTDSSATGLNAIAIGMSAVANVDRSIALGDGATTQAVVGTSGTTLQGTNYTFAGATPVGTLSVGSVGAERTLTNMAAGRLSGVSTDAVNGSQLFATNQALNSLDTSVGGLDDRAIKYDLNADTSVNYGQATLAGSGGTKLSNVAAGDLSATSTDAVNGSQLNATNDNVATNTANIATNTSNINGLKEDALQWDATANGGIGAYSANHMGSGPAKITNVAAGELSASSSDAVNGSQLYTTNQQVALNTSGLTELGSNVSTLQQDALLWDPALSAFSAKHGATSNNKITHVAAADLNASSTDAVNGSQLYATNNRVSQVENAITNIDLGTMKYVNVNSQGPAASAQGTEAIAVGPSATASGDNSIATGNNAQSTGSAAIALGSDASASGANSIAVGSTASSTADNSVALGAGSVADRNNTVSVGSTDNQRQITNVAAGTEDTDAVNVAQLKNITNTVSTVNTDINELDNGTDGMFQVNNSSVKAKPQATGKDALAGGAGSSASAENSMAVGTGAQSSGINSVALGTNSLADRDNTVSVGAVGSERQITNVAAGTQGTDAVNVNQLNSGISSANQYTDSKFNSLKNMVDDNKDKMSAGIAGAMAMASLTQPYTPGASMLSIGSAAYQNQSAIALGVSTISESGKWVTKLQGNSNTQGDLGIAIGVGYQW